MNLTTLLLLIGRAMIPLLGSVGKGHQADLLDEALTAVSAGKDIDDIMAALAKQWETNGEPSFDDIAKARADIQARMNA